MNALVSIVIPLYNKENSIKNTIDSVLSQSYSNLELIIVNDGSTDNSKSIVEKYQDTRIRLLSQENHGISYSRNKGIKEAKGEWILFLDADDLLLPKSLEKLLNSVTDSFTMISGNFIVNKNGLKYKYLTETKKIKYNSKSIYKALIQQKIFLRAGSFIMPTSFAKKHLFDISLSRYEDLKFLTTCYENLNIQYIPELVMSYETAYNEACHICQENWSKDYGFHLEFENNNIWKNLFLGEYLYQTIKYYPTKRNYLNQKYRPFKKYVIYSKLIGLAVIIKNKIFHDKTIN